VTGGGRGIGAAICRRAAAGRYRVVVNYASNAATADRLAGEIADAGGEAVAIRADVASEADVLAMFGAAIILGALYLFLARRQLRLDTGDTW